MFEKTAFDRELKKLDTLAPKGYFVGLHIRFTSALMSIQTYDPAWMDHYTENGYVMHDPMTAWGFCTTGWARWSNKAISDPSGILREAARFGLTYGATISYGPARSRTIASVARGDREFADSEIVEVEQTVIRLHDMIEAPRQLTAAQAEALRLTMNGKKNATVAASLGIPENTFKARLSSARQKLESRAAVEVSSRHQFEDRKTMSRKTLDRLLVELAEIAPAGYTVGLHIRFASPLVYHSTYPEEWVKYYNDNSYYLRDPLVFWGVGKAGTKRWSQIPLPDPFNVIGQAASYGLKFGAVSSYGPITSRSIVGISRADREFKDDELEVLTEITKRLHIEAKPPTELTPAQIEALQCVANGDRHAAASAKIGISESAFKARLKAARIRLEARTTSEAVRKAREYRLL